MPLLPCLKGNFHLTCLIKIKQCSWNMTGSDPQSEQGKDMEQQQRGLKSFMCSFFFLFYNAFVTTVEQEGESKKTSLT